MLDYQMRLSERMFSKYSYILDMDDCYDLAEDVLTACDEKPQFMLILKEWMNGKTKFHDYIFNDFSLIELACRLDEKTPNIPIAILIFYLEDKVESEYRALTVVAHQKCVCDRLLLKGELCKFAIKDDGIWYFMNDNQNSDNLRECQMWQILLLNPGLIIQMTYDYRDGTAIILQEDFSYLIEMEANKEE